MNYGERKVLVHEIDNLRARAKKLEEELVAQSAMMAVLLRVLNDMRVLPASMVKLIVEAGQHPPTKDGRRVTPTELRGSMSVPKEGAGG